MVLEAALGLGLGETLSSGSCDLELRGPDREQQLFRQLVLALKCLATLRTK